jgi:hypothetical protein
MKDEPGAVQRTPQLRRVAPEQRASGGEHTRADFVGRKRGDDLACLARYGAADLSLERRESHRRRFAAFLKAARSPCRWM